MDRGDVLRGLKREAVEPGRGTVAVAEVTEAVERRMVVDRHLHVVGADRVLRGCLSDLHLEVAALEAELHEARVIVRIRRGEEHAAGVVARPARRVLLQELTSDVQEALLADLEAVVRRGLDLGTVAAAGDAGGGHDVGKIGVVLGDDVDHAGDRVGAVLRGGAVAQDLDALDRTGRDRVEVGADCAAAERAIEVDQRALVAALAVDQDQDLVGSQAAQARGIDVVRTVGHGLRRRYVGRGQGRQHASGLGPAAARDLVSGDDVDRDRRVHVGARRARSDDHDDLGQQLVERHWHVDVGRLAGGDREALLDRAEPVEVGPEGDRSRRCGDLEPAELVGGRRDRGALDRDRRTR